LELTPQTEPATRTPSLRRSVLRAVPGTSPRRRPRGVVACADEGRANADDDLLPVVPPLQRPSRKPTPMTAPRGEQGKLSASIVAAVTANPGITTNVLCREVRVRKSDVLAELEALRREQLLRFENGYRGSKCWYLVPGRGNQFLTCSRPLPASTAAAEVAEKD